MKLTNFSINRPITILMIACITVVLGVMSFSKLGLDMLPDIEFPVVSVITNYQGVASEDIEEMITKPIEDSVATVKDVKSIKSVSQEGVSMVMVEFNSGTNVDFAAQDLRDKISLIEQYLPEDADRPFVLKMDVTAMPVLGYGITSDNLDTLELKKLLEDNFKNKIERLDGVASVELKGGWEREILVKLDKPKLDAYGLTQNQIVNVLRGENVNLSGGFITEETKEFSLRTVGEYQNLEEIGNTVITVKNGAPIYLKDIAEIVDSHQEERSYCRTNGQDSILMMVNKQSGANTIQTSQAVKKELAELENHFSDKVNFALVMDQSRLIKQSTDSVTQSAIIGGLLAILLVFLFLRNWRPTLAIAVAIPLSLIATFIPLAAAGYTLNLMTLGGLTLGIGMLVDNAVVVIENIYRHLEKNKGRKEAAKIGASEVGMAITAATLTTVVVFLPMVFGEGIAGQLSRGLALTIVFALACSLFTALTLVPMMASKIFKKRTAEEYKKTSGEENFKKVQKVYQKILKWSLAHRVAVILTTVGILITTVAAIPLIGTEFMPTSDQSMMIMKVEMPVGTSLEETSKKVQQVEKIIISQTGDDLISATSFGGISEMSNEGASVGMGSGGVNEAQIMVRFKDKKERKRSSSEIQEIIRENVPRIKGLKISFMDMSGAMMGGTSSPVEIKIFGKDLDKLKSIANETAQKISKVEGARDVSISLNQGKPEMVIKIDREKASRLGLTVGQIGSVVRNSLQGVAATQLRKGGEETDIRVRYDKVYRNDLESIENLPIVSPSGARISLKQVVQISKEEGPVKIDREDQLRVVSVTANTADRPVGDIVNDIKKELNDSESSKLPNGYFIEYGGSYKQMQDTFGVLATALVLAILLVYMVMASQFESLIYPLIAMAELPLAFIGVGLALLITGQNLSLPSFMGIIILAGIVVNNAIVLIDYINQLRARGIEKRQAIIKGGTNRLRPILITSLTTIFGMLPMAAATSEGSEMMKPMAIAVIGGLTVSTILTLIVIPVIYSLAEKKKT